jgi:carbon storage regulator CsrA
MLVLSRNSGEKIKVGDAIVEILGVSRSTGKVRIGIEAPKSVEIWRTELLDPTTGKPAAPRKVKELATPLKGGLE